MTEPNTNDTTVSTPDDFAAYEHWRDTGELPANESESEATDEESEAPESAPESDPETDQEQESDDEDGEEEKPAKKGGFQRRIDKLTRDKRELEERLSRIEGKLAEKPAAQPETKQTAVDATDPEPKIEDFDDYDKYARAVARWEVRQELAAEKAAKAKADAETAAVEQRKALASKWAENVKEFTKTAKDFNDVMEAASSLPVTPAMEQAILEEETGPAIAYHLAKHPKEVERIAQLSDIAAAREIGKLAAKLAKAPEPPKPKITNAPPPITPVSKTAKTAVSNIYDEKVANDFDAYEKAREAQLKKRK